LDRTTSGIFKPEAVSRRNFVDARLASAWSSIGKTRVVAAAQARILDFSRAIVFAR
jgi:hypothetical protein